MFYYLKKMTTEHMESYDMRKNECKESDDSVLAIRQQRSVKRIKKRKCETRRKNKNRAKEELENERKKSDKQCTPENTN